MDYNNISSAGFNLREIVKQMILLEDHLTDDKKYCMDCIRKHLLFIEALADEACTLDPLGSLYIECKKISDTAKRWMVYVTDNYPNGSRYNLAADLRSIRKDLMNKYFDPRLP